MFAVIWPRTEDLRTSIPLRHPCPPALVQATIAIPNLAVAATLLYQGLPDNQAHAATAAIEALMFKLIDADQASYPVFEVLRLADEQRLWEMETLGYGADPNIRSNLDTIIRTVHWLRLAQYQDECRKGFRMLVENSSQLGAFGPLGFIAKRFLSHSKGQPILREDDLFEVGFPELGVVSNYFTFIYNSLAEEMKK